MINVPNKSQILEMYGMRNGDDTLAYTQTGEMVIPVAVQKANPALVAAAKATMSQMGANPNQFVVGSPSGKYNPQTGAQEFNFTLDDLEKYYDMGVDAVKEYGGKAVDYATDALDYVANTRTGQSLATGALTAGSAKLKGASNTQALSAGVGAGLGYATGDALGDAFSDDSPKVEVDSNSFVDAGGSALASLSTAGLTGAAIGGKAGFDFMRPDPKPDMRYDSPVVNDPNLPSKTVPVNLPSLPTNEQPNVSATLPEDLPIAPLTPAGMQTPAGVSYKRKVKDRDTGRYGFTTVSDNDAASFSRALSGRGRRSGFGNSNRIIIG